MRGAIADLLQFSDGQFLDDVSKGIAHIVEYAESLDSLADRLVEMGEHRGGGIVRALAEEEAAKVLILVDAVRCPPAEAKDQSRTLKGFYSHLAKHIYSEACWWRSADFAEVMRAIERERLPYYLDGPNEVDWIFANSAKTDREHSMYVDYVQDVTEKDGEHHWVSPLTRAGPWRYERATPSSLIAARSLHRVGMTTPAGLSVVADVWRTFRPEPETRFPELSRKIRETLNHVTERGLCSEADLHLHGRMLIDHWPFPLWSLDLTLADAPTREELRKERKTSIRQLMEIEAQRDPPPKIRRKKVEALSKAYDAWMLEEEQWRNSLPENEGSTFRVVPTSAPSGPFESYVRLQRIMRELTLEERMDLAALAWFGRERRDGWEHLHAHSRTIILEETLNYECGLGRYWLRGLERWESPPETPTSFRSSGKGA